MALAKISKEEALKALTELKDQFNCIMETAKKDFKESPETFSSEGIWKTDFLSDVYGDAYQRLGIKTRKEFENFFLDHVVKSDKGLLHTYHEIKKLEDDFDEFMKGLDQSFGFSALQIPQVEDLSPLETSVSLLHVPSKRAVNLVDFIENSEKTLLVFVRYYS